MLTIWVQFWRTLAPLRRVRRSAWFAELPCHTVFWIFPSVQAYVEPLRRCLEEAEALQAEERVFAERQKQHAAPGGKGLPDPAAEQFGREPVSQSLQAQQQSLQKRCVHCSAALKHLYNLEL